MRQLAWLEAPKDKPEGDKSKEKRKSRLQERRDLLKDPKYMPQLPPVEHGAYLLGWLFDVGPSMPGSMGSVTVSETELGHWQRNAGVRLTPWESRFLRHLSASYVAEFAQASDPKRESPWQAPVATDEDKRATALSMRQTLRDL